MTSIVDERGFNQGFRLTEAQKLRLRRRAAAIAKAMTNAVSDRVRVLELGCGTGELSFELQRLSGARVTAVDLSQKFIDLARTTFKGPDIEFKVVDLNGAAPELESNSYHYIVGNGILHHLYDQLDSFLPRLRQMLLPGGKIVFWEPNLLNPYIFAIFRIPWLRRLARLEPEEMAFTPADIDKRLRRAGFRDVRAVTRDFLLPHTPIGWIDAAVELGDRLERCYGVRALAQSVFLTAVNGTTDSKTNSM